MFDESNFLKYLDNRKLKITQSKEMCDMTVNGILVKNVPYKPHEFNGYATYNLYDLDLIYKYITVNPKEKEVDYKDIKNKLV